MRSRFTLSLALALAGCGSNQTPPYNNNDLQLLTRYSAKELCTCAFVMDQTDEFCARFTRASPNLKTFRIDRVNKVVETQAVVFWGARARFVSPRRGCILE